VVINSWERVETGWFDRRRKSGEMRPPIAAALLLLIATAETAGGWSTEGDVAVKAWELKDVNRQFDCPDTAPVCASIQDPNNCTAFEAAFCPCTCGASTLPPTPAPTPTPTPSATPTPTPTPTPKPKSTEQPTAPPHKRPSRRHTRRRGRGGRFFPKNWPFSTPMPFPIPTKKPYRPPPTPPTCDQFAHVYKEVFIGEKGDSVVCYLLYSKRAKVGLVCVELRGDLCLDFSFTIYRPYKGVAAYVGATKQCRRMLKFKDLNRVNLKGNGTYRTQVCLSEVKNFDFDGTDCCGNDLCLRMFVKVARRVKRQGLVFSRGHPSDCPVINGQTKCPAPLTCVKPVTCDLDICKAAFRKKFGDGPASKYIASKLQCCDPKSRCGQRFFEEDEPVLCAVNCDHKCWKRAFCTFYDEDRGLVPSYFRKTRTPRCVDLL